MAASQATALSLLFFITTTISSIDSTTDLRRFEGQLGNRVMNVELCNHSNHYPLNIYQPTLQLL